MVNIKYVCVIIEELSSEDITFVHLIQNIINK